MLTRTFPAKKGDAEIFALCFFFHYFRAGSDEIYRNNLWGTSKNAGLKLCVLPKKQYLSPITEIHSRKIVDSQLTPTETETSRNYAE